MDFDYKKYSLENLENWVHDAMSSAEATPQEIYDVIKGVVEDNYYTYKKQTTDAYELLALLNGNGKGHIKAYDEYLEKKENLICNKEDSSPECQKSWNDFWEEYYYPEEVNDDGMRPWGHSDIEYSIANKKEDKVKKWILPVEETKDADTDKIEYFVSFPDDLLDAANLKEGDQIEWVDQGNGSYLIKKVEKKTLSYQEAIDAGWKMTADGFWIKGN